MHSHSADKNKCVLSFEKGEDTEKNAQGQGYSYHFAVQQNDTLFPRP